MASLIVPRNLNQEVLGKVLNMVRQRRSMTTIIQRIRAAIKGTKEATIRNHVLYAREIQRASNAFAKASSNKTLSSLTSFSRSANPTVTRVGYSFRFYDRDLGQWVTKGFSADISSAASKGATLEIIRGKILDWIDKFYPRRTSPNLTWRTSVRDFSIVEMEGL